jgi:hypothetical protein
MAFRFVDPMPFLPEGADRLVIPRRPLIKRVVTGRVQEQNNDLAIAMIHPMPQEQVDFEVIREALVDFLNVQRRIPYQNNLTLSFGSSLCSFQLYAS